MKINLTAVLTTETREAVNEALFTTNSDIDLVAVNVGRTPERRWDDLDRIMFALDAWAVNTGQTKGGANRYKVSSPARKATDEVNILRRMAYAITQATPAAPGEIAPEFQGVFK